MLSFPSADKLLKYSFIFLFILLIAAACSRPTANEPVDTGSPPATPSGLNVDGAFDGQIGISWRKNNEPDLSGYNVYRSKGIYQNYSLIKFITDNFFIDSGLDYDSVYFYKVSAVDKQNRESKLSDSVFAIPINILKPIEPYIVNINARNFEGKKEIFLSWSPSIDKDIAFYEVYRDTIDFDTPKDALLIAKAINNNYSDQKDLAIGQKYFYRICAVDKGNLKSPLTHSVSDYILDEPILISPADQSEINEITPFKFRAVSKPAQYKLVIQNSPIGGVIQEFNFTSGETEKEISVDLAGLRLDDYKTYFWRVLTFTNNNTEPNSYSKLFSFYYNPK
jgi:hypothetical protein